MKPKKLSLVLVFFIFVTNFAFAEVQSPVTMLQKVADNLVAKLEQNKSRLNNRSVIDHIVDQTILPIVATNVMAGSVVGRRYWLKASSDARQQFIDQFKSLVVSTYAAAFESYDGDKVKFFPLRTDYKKAQYLRVLSEIVRRSGQRIPISYNLMRSGDSWKVYDFSIENVSMVSSYRSQFAGVLSQSGMQGLIAKLKRHNKKVAQ